MDPRSSSATARAPGEALAGLLRGERARALRAQLARRHQRRSAEEVEEAVQSACRYFLDQGETISDPAQLYSWICTVAHRTLVREDDHRQHELAVDPLEGGLERAVSAEPGPAEELIALEDDAELTLLVREVTSSLSERRREILALWGAGHKRAEIAARLGLSERTVKRDLREIMEKAREVLREEAGGGCDRGESLVLRLVCGLTGATEAEHARAHLESCGRCAAFSEKLEAWREKAGALLPMPAAEAASSGLVERITHRAGHALASAKQQIFGGGAQVKQQAAAAASHTPSVDATPLAGVRPGPAVAVIAGCLAIGGGATYCAQQGVDPLGAARNLIAGGQESEPPPSSPPPQASEPSPVVTPPPESEAPVYEPTEATPPQEYEPTPSPEPAPEPEPEPAPEPEPEPTPPPEQSFEPASPEYPAVESSPEGSDAETAAPARAAPVPTGEPPQFGGP
ncbi:MAG: RNA polymerase sigma factor [Solirubrobacterales bacterium]